METKKKHISSEVADNANSRKTQLSKSVRDFSTCIKLCISKKYLRTV